MTGPGTDLGRIERIWLKRVRRGPMDSVTEAELEAGQGIVGNANRGGRRQVTLIDGDAWERAQRTLGVDLDPSLRRANLLIRGVALQDTRGRRLRVGDGEILIRGETRPCTLLDDAHPGLRDALDPEWRGGVFGEVTGSGSIRIGDVVEWVQ